MLAVTAPLMLPNPIAIPSVTLRLYDPSTLLATQALDVRQDKRSRTLGKRKLTLN